LIFLCLTCLFPVATYLLWLAVVNSKLRPTMMSGAWDFAGVLFALSGFFLLAGPAVLALINVRWAGPAQPGRLGDVMGLTGESWLIWIAVWLAYFLTVVIGSGWLLWKRRRVTVIYNIDPDTFEELLIRALDRLALEGARMGNRVFIAQPGAAQESAAAGKLAPEPGDASGNGPVEAARRPAMAGRTQRRAEVELDPFPALRHLSLHWYDSDPLVRQEVEAELGRALAEVEAEPNRAAAWFLTLAGLMFTMLLVGMVVLILAQTAGGH
jgi:hypothetical protein